MGGQGLPTRPHPRAAVPACLRVGRSGGNAARRDGAPRPRGRGQRRRHGTAGTGTERTPNPLTRLLTAARSGPGKNKPREKEPQQHRFLPKPLTAARPARRRRRVQTEQRAQSLPPRALHACAAPAPAPRAPSPGRVAPALLLLLLHALRVRRGRKVLEHLGLAQQEVEALAPALRLQHAAGREVGSGDLGVVRGWTGRRGQPQGRRQPTLTRRGPPTARRTAGRPCDGPRPPIGAP